ncbi:DUF2782 domain-containing protein [Endozoicomonas ascidiicola]|uniref:DUF2782 domain-containing protein n=1 Tax=Endozoicomonas ascidiicola TaxID=1698521 RepID=UPI0008344002|nr:DUF2782 domain-containing protein [Endozoicomonas ascidiicola]
MFPLIRRTQLGLIFLPLFLLMGCAAKNPDNTGLPDISQNTSPKSGKTVLVDDAIQQIPKHLRPAELEKRDDTTVVIRAGDHRTYKEYRVGGQLYAIHIIPKVGKPYYLIAADEEGNPIDPTKRTMLVPSWTILEWR